MYEVTWTGGLIFLGVVSGAWPCKDRVACDSVLNLPNKAFLTCWDVPVCWVQQGNQEM